MILNAIINLFANFLRFVTNPIQTIDSSFISQFGFYNTLRPFFSVVMYFFLIYYITPIIGLVIAIITYKIIVAIFRALWSIIPFMG